MGSRRAMEKTIFAIQGLSPMTIKSQKTTIYCRQDSRSDFILITFTQFTSLQECSPLYKQPQIKLIENRPISQSTESPKIATKGFIRFNSDTWEE
jgi:hypothetical protein